MKILRFIIEKQSIRQDPNCDSSDLIPGTRDDIIAEFSFPSEWNGFAKVAAFYSPLGTEYEPQILTNKNRCVIPSEALAKRSFKVQIIGKKNDITIRTNKTIVYQNGGKT